MHPLLNNLFADYDKTRQEINQQFFSCTIPTDRRIKYVNGVVIGKWKEQDEQTLKAMQLNVSEEEYKRAIRQLLMTRKFQLQQIVDPDILKQGQLASCFQQIQELDKLPLEDWLQRNMSGFTFVLPNLTLEERRSLMYIYFAYETHRLDINRPCNREQPNIEALYGDYFEKSSQFHKYGLLPIDNERHLYCLNPPRLYDTSKNKTIYLKNLPLDLAHKLDHLIIEKKIGNLAVRGDDMNIYNGMITCEYIMEELERGRIFSLANLGKPEVSKLYSRDYENTLWVVIDQESVTFEELCRDFRENKEMVVTQVVHLQYGGIGQDAIITHIDHEYIFYTLEEFIERTNNPDQKGTASARLKSFKVDNAEIDINLTYDVVWKDADGNEMTPIKVPFICYVLDCYFDHKDLLKEYFQELIGLTI